MIPRRLSRTYAAAALAASVLVVPLGAAHAQAAPSVCDAVVGNLVANCGFEAAEVVSGTLGTLAPWVVTKQAKYPYYGVTLGGARSGHVAFFFSETYPPAASTPQLSLTQMLATTPGQAYTISFWAALVQRDNTPALNEVRVLFGGAAVFDQVLPFVPEYRQYTVTGVATGASTALTVTGYNNYFKEGSGPNGYDYVDDFVVTAGATAVPEPGTWALLATGLVGLVAAAARRRCAA